MPDFRHVLSLAIMALAASTAMAQIPPPPTGSGTLAGAAAAQDPAVAGAAIAPSSQPPAPMAADATSAPACELHVWPAARVGAVTQGAGAGFGLIGALIDSASHADQNKRDTAFITGALDADAQARVLRDLDLPTRLHLPPSRVIIHDEGIDLQTDNPHRLSDSKAQCYAEFVVRSLIYFKNVAYKGQMRTFLDVRGFDGVTVKFDFHDSKHENLEVKLPKEAEDTGPATDALISAFRGDVIFFADKFARKTK